MMYIFILASAGAALHAFLFGRWLAKNGNMAGAICVYALSLLCLALPVYRYITAT